MQDLMPPINTQDKIFHDGDPTTGQLGTIVTALWLNNVQAATRDVQAEIKSVLAKAGMTPDPKKTNQLADAISQIVTSGNYASTAYVDNGLNKKIDKANISGVKGNDNDKVPSLNLFTTETGKLATKAELSTGLAGKQPAGNYATTEALNDGLSKKFDKSGGTISGAATVQKNGSALNLQQETANQALYLEFKDERSARKGIIGFDSGKANLSIHNAATGHTLLLGEDGKLKYNSVEVMSTGDFGLGSEVSFHNISGGTEDWPFGGTGGGKMVSSPRSTVYQGVLCWTKGGLFRLAGRTSSSSSEPTEFVEFLSTGNTKTDRNGYLRTSQAANEMQSVPIGASIIWNTSAPIPENFWANEGRSFSASEYPELAKIFTNLKLPDDRGYAIRVADNGRGIDPGRTVGTYQEDAMQPIQGKIEGSTYALFWSGNPSASGAFKRTDSIGKYADTGTINANQSRGFEIDSSLVTRTANETRMKNVAKILITRMK
ncbi:hypothetical protein [Providencia alcalifaciens]|uniref:hypothetical protein n=1 Tax=Providencia alcalifaciens TaxID=126385 RepID=UPI002AA0B0AF|nr:hypothetical protein [Providencia alcalifaciens]